MQASDKIREGGWGNGVGGGGREIQAKEEQDQLSATLTDASVCLWSLSGNCGRYDVKLNQPRLTSCQSHFYASSKDNERWDTGHNEPIVHVCLLLLLLAVSKHEISALLPPAGSFVDPKTVFLERAGVITPPTEAGPHPSSCRKVCISITLMTQLKNN